MTEESTSGQQTGTDKSFAALRSLGVRRRTDDKWIAGVCSGLADRLGVDPVIIRAALVLLTILGGVGVTIYLVAWALLPNDRDQIPAERALRDGHGGSIVLIIIAAFALFGGSWWSTDSGWGLPWGIALTGLLVWWLIKRPGGNPEADQRVRAQQPFAQVPPGTSATATWPAPAAGPTEPVAQTLPYAPSGQYGPSGSTAPVGPRTPTGQFGPSGSTAQASSAPPASQYGPSGHYGPPIAVAPPRTVVPKRRPRRSGGPLMALLALGLALATYGSLLWAGNEYSWTGDHTAVAIAGSLGAVGLMMVVLGLAGWRAGFLAFLAVILAFSSWTSSVIPAGIHFDGRVGDAVWAPVSVVEADQQNYRLGAGSGVLDLSGLPTEGLSTATPTPTIPIYVGAGELRVIVPADLTVKVEGHVSLGEIILPGDVSGNGSGNGGSDISRSAVIGDGPTEVVVDAGVGLGQITVVKE